jgi:hypothetical protein
MTYYTTRVCTKCMAAGTRNYEDFIGSVEGTLQMVKDMRADGVDAFFDKTDEGFVHFVTDDEALGQKYDMFEIDVDCEDEYEDDECEDDEYEDACDGADEL